MKITPYLNFDGNGVEALNYYRDTISAEITMSMTFGEMPEQPDWVTDENRDRLAHGQMRVGETIVMASDTAGQEPHEGFKGVTLHLSEKTPEAAKALFDTLAADGQVMMPFAETFWSKGFGMLHDKFGVSWMLDVEAG